MLLQSDDNREMIYHTFLFDENIWMARGVYIDGQGKYHSVAGQSVITHATDQWINDSAMHLEGNPAVEFRNRYEIEPMERNQEMTTWRSENPALGRMSGRFIIVDDSILSVFASADGVFQGTEYLRLIDDDLYWNRGSLLQGDKKASSWALELRRK